MPVAPPIEKAATQRLVPASMRSAPDAYAHTATNQTCLDGGFDRLDVAVASLSDAFMGYGLSSRICLIRSC
jgi:hypothetical protein